MFTFDMVKETTEIEPPRIIVYGTPGVGKTTFAASAGNSIIIPAEKGLMGVRANATPLVERYKDAIQWLDLLIKDQNNFKVVVIDTLDAFEGLIHQEIMSIENKVMSECCGGYGKAYEVAVNKYWRPMLKKLDILQSKGMICILIAHSKCEKFDDPERQAYDRYSPKLHKSATDLISEWADALLFATIRTTIEKDGENRILAKGYGSGGTDAPDRILRCVANPACRAKNRLGLPAIIPLDWQTLVSSIGTTHAKKN